MIPRHAPASAQAPQLPGSRVRRALEAYGSPYASPGDPVKGGLVPAVAPAEPPLVLTQRYPDLPAGPSSMVVSGPEAVVGTGRSLGGDVFRGLYTDVSGRKRPEADPRRSRLVTRMRAGGALVQIDGALFGGDVGTGAAAAAGGFARGAGLLAEKDAEQLRLERAGYDAWLENTQAANRAVGMAEAGATLDLQAEDRAASRADANYTRARRDGAADLTSARIYEADLLRDKQEREAAEALLERMGVELGRLAERGGTVATMAPLVARQLNLPDTAEGRAQAEAIAASYRADYDRGVANERSEEARGWRSLAISAGQLALGRERFNADRSDEAWDRAHPSGGGGSRGAGPDEARQMMDDYRALIGMKTQLRSGDVDQADYDEAERQYYSRWGQEPSAGGAGEALPRVPSVLDNPLGTAHGATAEDVADAEEAYELGLIGPAAYTEVTGRPAPRR